MKTKNERKKRGSFNERVRVCQQKKQSKEALLSPALKYSVSLYRKLLGSTVPGGTMAISLLIVDIDDGD